ncbi:MULTISPECIES: hypothetical protein [unclassified Streptomyces]|uniref:hypothetical protein n=1 Tax=unclassified Streptomyces TaxID=2593676 RepID=UPI00278C86C6|nr:MULTISPECIES: hypothetical protein [unclassified Streptomyces]
MGIADEVRSVRFGSSLSAQQLFTNRHSETAALLAKADEVRAARLVDPDLNLGLREPRRNVLVFHGAGGIGKTRLSAECERLFGLRPEPGGTRRAAIRIDFSEPSARDPELYLLALRAGLARLAPSFPAFDTCLALYWTRRHPGASLHEFVHQQSLLGGLVDREALAGNLRNFATGLLDSAGPVVGGATRALAVTWEAIRHARQTRTLERECPWFTACVQEEDLEELRLHLPLLLGWDLARLQRHGDVDVLLCLDTFEHVSHGAHRARRGDLEDTVARSIFHLPSVTALLTTRNRLDWGSELRAATFEYAGPTDWPGLVAETGGDQYRVGELSAPDCEDYLSGCLLNPDGTPAVPAPLRASIAAMSAGLPLYLDVAAQHFRNLATRGRTPTADDFARGLPQIVVRMMEDLDDDEADLLRTAALLGVFDRETLHVALPGLRAAAIERFLERGFVTVRGDGLHSVHELLQTSVRVHDAATSSPWSPEEWREAEGRLAHHWASWLQDPASSLRRDRRTHALAFWQLASLYATTDVDADALAQVIMQFESQGAWAAIDGARSQPEPLLTARGHALMHILDGILERHVGTVEEALDRYTLAHRSPDLTGDMRRLACQCLGGAYAMRHGDAGALYREVIEGADSGDWLAPVARSSLANWLSRRGDLVGALATARTIESQGDGEAAKRQSDYRRWEQIGGILLHAGQFDESVTAFERSRQAALAEGSPLMTATATRHVALASCWSRPAGALTIIDRAEALNRELGQKVGVAQCLTSRAVALTGTVPLGVVDTLLDEAHATFLDGGFENDALAPLAVAVFAAAVDHDPTLAEERRARLYEAAAGHRPHHWLAAADVWTGHRDEFDAMTWPQGPDRAWQDWTDVLTARRRARTTD